jgi:hypothetical protein
VSGDELEGGMSQKQRCGKDLFAIAALLLAIMGDVRARTNPSASILPMCSPQLIKRSGDRGPHSHTCESLTKSVRRDDGEVSYSLRERNLPCVLRADRRLPNRASSFDSWSRSWAMISESVAVWVCGDVAAVWRPGCECGVD